MGEFRVSERAEAELLEVYLYGVAEFGRPQAVKYQLSLEHCFSLLAEQPRMGRLARKLGEGVRRHEHGSHVILYRDKGDHVLILAIVHGRSVRRLKL
jgi:toxin ParE1/3/4